MSKVHRINKAITLVVTYLVSFMLFLDMSIVTLALPTKSRTTSVPASQICNGRF